MNVDVKAAMKQNKTLFDLPWEDVILPQIFPKLSLKDLFNFRCCSSLSKLLVETYFTKMKSVKIAGNNSRNIHMAFEVLSMHCNSLQHLDVARCKWLTNTLLMPMLKANYRLISVNLNECGSITASSLQLIILNCKRLKSLKIAKCIWITIGTIEALALHQYNLQSIDISHCNTLSERCLMMIFAKFHQLTNISMEYTITVTDKVLVCIAQHCALLKHLNVMGCFQITEAGISYIGSNCLLLESILVQGCPNITDPKTVLISHQSDPDQPPTLTPFDLYPICFVRFTK